MRAEYKAFSQCFDVTADLNVKAQNYLSTLIEPAISDNRGKVTIRLLNLAVHTQETTKSILFILDSEQSARSYFIHWIY